MRFSRWDQEASTADSNAFLLGLALRHANEISDAQQREHLIACITRNDVLSLCDLDFAYTTLSPSDSLHTRQIGAFFSKRADLDLGVNRREAAERKFIDAEELCRQTNTVFRKRARGEFLFSPRVESVLFRAQRKVAFILGDVPNLSDLQFRFGPGATTQVPKRTASTRRKLGEVYACSEDFVEFLPEFLGEFPHWTAMQTGDGPKTPVEIHDGRLVFVPKTAKVDRAVVVEPMLNSMFQLGVGDHIARRLRRVGIDIRDQSRNQRLAREGSLTGALATLDLSSASDTVARELVYELLPVDWALFLEKGRTSHVVYQDYRFYVEKFSSMGNGYTFPLETLIFYALAAACCEEGELGVVSVYGDDIIVPSSRYDLLSEVLTATGFLLNSKKSFATGPFRESCGKDYHSGFDIRPCYIKTALAPRDLFRLHNFYMRTGYSELAAVVLTAIPPQLMLWGPDGFGDGHLIGGPPLRPCNRDKGWCGYVFDTYTFRNVTDFTVGRGDSVLPVYSTYAKSVSEMTAVLSGGNLSIKVRETDPLIWRKGNLGVTTPGKKGYNRISIYTLRDS